MFCTYDLTVVILLPVACSSAGPTSIWLLDLALCWHYLCPSFSDLLRLAIVHLGLLQWPYAFTPYGLSPQYEVCVGLCSETGLIWSPSGQESMA